MVERVLYMLRLAVSTEYRRMTGRQTDAVRQIDRRTDILPQHSPRYPSRTKTFRNILLVRLSSDCVCVGYTRYP